MKRVLVWGLTNNVAGTEAVIKNVVACLRDRICFDFLTFEDVPNHADIVGNGNRVIKVPNKRTAYAQYKRAMKAFFREHACEYDVVWTNLNILNNIDSLELAARYDIPKRILHSHNAGNDGKPHQKVLCTINAKRIDRYVTDRWACSNEAGAYLFGDSPFTVIPNAIDMARFSFDEHARTEIRAELGLGESFVVGAVGRLSEQKNHAFLIDVMMELLKLRPDARLVVAGSGELQVMLEELAFRYGLAGCVSFIGSRSDVPRLLSAFDAYAMPSLFEGLPVSLLEAQASGLACVVSDNVTREVAISEDIRFVPLDSPRTWALVLARVPVGRIQLNAKAKLFDLNKLDVLMSRLFDLESNTFG